MRLGDILKLIHARWKNNRRTFILVILNISAAILILVFFFNLGFNINGFLKNKILTQERYLHTVFISNGTDIAVDSEFLRDDRVANARIIYATDISITSVDGNPAPSYLTLSIINADKLIFDDESGADAPFISEMDNFRSGIIVSSSIQNFLGENILGKNVSFTYMGKDYVLPVTAVLSATAESNFDETYISSMYVFIDKIAIIPDTIYAADIRIDTLKNVPDFVADYSQDGISILSYCKDVNYSLTLISIVTIIFCSAGIVFLFFSSFGIINSLQLQSERNVKHLSLLKILGFSRLDLNKLCFFESVIMTFLSLSVVAMIYIPILLIMKSSNIFVFEMLTPEVLFKVNFGIIGLTAVLSFVLITFCNFFVNIKIDKQNIIETLKKE